MLFNSIDFVIFFPLVVATFFLAPQRFQWMFLLAASYFFYAYWNVYYLLLIVFTTGSSYWFAILVGRTSERSRRKLYLVCCLALNLLILLVFKYYNFFADSANLLLSRLGSTSELGMLNVLLPVGISFYTFQTFSYLIDVYRGQKEVEKHLGIYALYVVFFPQLVAGPIERSVRLMPQFHETKMFSWDRLMSGLEMIIWGFFLKLVIADRVAGYVSAIYTDPGRFSGGHYILSTVLFAYQIFGDFAGYSSIAIGTARILGFELMTNFRRPYWAHSMGEFWSRWHISLSTWFRDYVYIPMGGNRVSLFRHFLNLLAVFLLSGLWHGANWTFVVWGGIHGILLIFETMVAKLWKRRTPCELPELQSTLLGGVRRAYVIFAVCVTWVFFKANTIEDAFYILGHLFSGLQLSVDYAGRLIVPFTGDNTAVAAFLCTIGFIFLLEGVHFVQEKKVGAILNLWESSPIFRASGLGILALIILLFGDFSSGRFIYFQF